MYGYFPEIKIIWGFSTFAFFRHFESGKKDDDLGLFQKTPILENQAFTVQ